MEEISGGGSRRPLGSADEREGKVAAKKGVQKKVAATESVKKGKYGKWGGGPPAEGLMSSA